MIIVLLVISALIPVAAAVLFYLLEKKTNWNKLPYIYRQIFVGVVFGLLACLATHFGITTNGVVLNVRNASPLIAGLLFGGPAGIIAGIVGGLHRYVVAFFGIGVYSQVACSVATVCAGIFGALSRKFIFENKRSSWLYGLLIGTSTEVFHMILLFITKADDLNRAFEVVYICSPPMIIATAASVMLAEWIIVLIRNEKSETKGEPPITQTFQTTLLISIIIAFGMTSFFTFSLNSRIAEQNTYRVLLDNVKSIEAGVNDNTESFLRKYNYWIATEFNMAPEMNNEVFKEICSRYNVPEIYIADRSGRFIYTTNLKTFMNNYTNYRSLLGFKDVIWGKEPDSVGAYEASFHNSNVFRKYVATKLKDGGMVIVGYDLTFLISEVNFNIRESARNKLVGKTGYLMVVDPSGNIVSHGRDAGEKNIAELGICPETLHVNEVFKTNLYGEKVFYMYGLFSVASKYYYVVAVYPEKEALFSMNLSIYMGIFTEILIFTMLFVLVYMLIKNVIINNIHKINSSLARITGGNLNEVVDVRANREFASLSDDINYTVDTLKKYIAEAETRIDKELEFAKSIQLSALPNVFPPFPNRDDFDIFATMDTAKEVGGDFYDFYLLENNKLGFLIADVSGKGIPAAMFMMTAKTIIKSYVESGMEVDQVFTNANAKLCEGNEAGMFVTAWLGIVDLRTGILTYANAGHNPPLIRHKNGKFDYLKTRANFVLAGMEGVRYRKHELRLSPGDEIFIYTDGVTEATDVNNQLYGEDRLLSVINTNPDEGVESRLRNIKVSIDSFAGEADQFDDITMLSVKLKYFAGEESILTSPDLDATKSVLDYMYRRTKLAELPQKVRNRVQVTVDEIYSNILMYSGADYAEVSCASEEDTFTLVFRDNGVPYNPLEKEDPDVTLSAAERRIGGLGIFMVKKMASDISYDFADGQNILKVSFLALEPSEGVSK